MKKHYLFFTVILVLALLFTGCGSKAPSAAYDSSNGYYSESYTEKYAYEAPAAEEELYIYDDADTNEAYVSLSGNVGSAKPVSERKLIQDINIYMEVENPSDALISIQEKAVTLGGYMLSSSDYYDSESNTGSAYITVRIPTGNSNTIRAYLENDLKADINNYSTSAEDVTDTYYDLQTRIEQGESELKALYSILDDCTTIDEVLSVRNQISWIQSDVESMKGSFKRLNELTSYDTYYIDIDCHPNLIEGNSNGRIISGNEFLAGIANGFGMSFRALINGAAYLLIFLVTICLPCLAILVIVLVILKITKKARKARREKRAANKAEAETNQTFSNPYEMGNKD